MQKIKLKPSVVFSKLHFVQFKRASYQTVAIRNFRKQMKQCLEHLGYNKVLILERHKRPVAVILKYREYQNLIRQRQLLLKDFMEVSQYEYDDKVEEEEDSKIKDSELNDPSMSLKRPWPRPS